MNLEQRRARRHAGRETKARARAGGGVDYAAMEWNELRAAAAAAGVSTHRRTRAAILADLTG